MVLDNKINQDILKQLKAQPVLHINQQVQK